jgi:hypothetical protein
MGSNPGTVFWMDVSNVHENNENRGSRMGCTKFFFKLTQVVVKVMKLKLKKN